ncbi:hypothetical protein GCM10010411_69480 [Actinomadura fulvescens]|uniref:Uncharacterized protein n=1 Tax=Actinomadura fulvescens TaxID=46160 RepID=A0ABN3QD93_9ACTN
MRETFCEVSDVAVGNRQARAWIRRSALGFFSLFWIQRSVTRGVRGAELPAGVWGGAPMSAAPSEARDRFA